MNRRFVDPDNDEIKSAHIVCAASEMPLKPGDKYFE